VIPNTNTISYPGTMVVHVHYTLATNTAVMSLRWFYNLALITESKFLKQVISNLSLMTFMHRNNTQQRLLFLFRKNLVCILSLLLALD
jgi:hypothetical protein